MHPPRHTSQSVPSHGWLGLLLIIISFDKVRAASRQVPFFVTFVAFHLHYILGIFLYLGFFRLGVCSHLLVVAFSVSLFCFILCCATTTFLEVSNQATTCTQVHLVQVCQLSECSLLYIIDNFCLEFHISVIVSHIR